MRPCVERLAVALCHRDEEHGPALHLGVVTLAMSLSNEEIEACREAFARFDKDNSGAIDAWELRATLQCAKPQPPN